MASLAFAVPAPPSGREPVPLGDEKQEEADGALWGEDRTADERGHGIWGDGNLEGKQ